MKLAFDKSTKKVRLYLEMMPTKKMWGSDQSVSKSNL
jgi:hypothetical protein